MKRTKAPGQAKTPKADKKTIRQELAETVPAPEMKRTRAPAGAKKCKDMTEDGRPLGPLCSSLVPDEYKDMIPDKAPSHKSRAQNQYRRIQEMTRTRLPLALQDDGDVETAGQKFRMRGLNQARFNALYAALSEGMTITGACQFAGIVYESYRTWMKKGSEGHYPYTVLYAALKEAEAALERKLINAIITAGTEKEVYTETTYEHGIDEHGLETEKTKTVEKTLHPKWQAAAWMLERTRPEFRLNADTAPLDTGNSEDDDLLAMDGTSMGTVSEVGTEHE